MPDTDFIYNKESPPIAPVSLTQLHRVSTLYSDEAIFHATHHDASLALYYFSLCLTRLKFLLTSLILSTLLSLPLLTRQIYALEHYYRF